MSFFKLPLGSGHLYAFYLPYISPIVRPYLFPTITPCGCRYVGNCCRFCLHLTFVFLHRVGDNAMYVLDAQPMDDSTISGFSVANESVASESKSESKPLRGISARSSVVFVPVTLCLSGTCRQAPAFWQG